MAALLRCLAVLWLGAAATPGSASPSGAAPRVTVQGVGSSLPLSLYTNAIFSYGFMDPSVEVTLSSRLSDPALCRLLNYSRECAAGDTTPPWYADWASLVSPPTAAQYARYPDLQLYPTVATAVVPVYNLNGVADLVLSMATLAKIWSGRITMWDHPDIVAGNPNFASWNVPTNQPIVLLSHQDSSPITELFKKAMAGVDRTFRAQVGTSPLPVWNGTQVRLEKTFQFVISYVMRNNYTLGYASLGNALAYKMPMAKLNRSGVVVEASGDSVQYAVLSRGLVFGNNGDDAAHLTGDLLNAVNPLAWPISTFTYLAVRKATLQPGATCATVAAMVRFWAWFWGSAEVERLAPALGFSVLPAVVMSYVVGRFQSDMQCGGSLVWQEADTPMIAGFGPGATVLIFDKFQQAYALVNTSVVLNYTVLAEDPGDVTPLLQAGGFVVSSSPILSPDVLSLALAAEAVVGISQYPLTLDVVTLAKILNGDIQTWLHPTIAALNPQGIVDGNGVALTDPAQRIVLLQGPTATSAPVVALLRQYYPAYTGAAIRVAEKWADPMLTWSAVLGTPYSFSIAAFVGALPPELQLTAIVAPSGAAVAPSLATAKACAANATLNPTTKSVALALTNGSCYPLLVPLYVSLRRQCPAPSPATARAVAFLRWMFNKATLEVALDALNLVSLVGVSSALQADNDAALVQLACAGQPTAASPAPIGPLLLEVLVPIALVVLLGLAACGWWLWRVTEHNRILRKKFSNDNVAESCAEAIACFDLDAVAWLREVKEPNKIQLAFLAIISLLTEVKPYIPDQLLSRLSASRHEAAAATEGEDTEGEPAAGELPSPRLPGSLRLGTPGGKDSPMRDKQRLAMSQRTVPPSPRKVYQVRQSTASSEGASQVLALRDWHRRRCTYMCVRFGSAGADAEQRLRGLAQAAGQIVDVTKAHGATIDAVGVDFVTVHWGVTATSGASAARAVYAALEIDEVRDVLPEDQQETFWLQMGIGKGPCDCGTVSSESGHRFFVVWGAEASLAMEVATSNLPKRVLSTLLVSPAVHQDVQYTVRCLPRLWHGDVLLWEPVQVLQRGEDDEWMYELKKLHAGAPLDSHALLGAFLLARDKAASPADVAARVAQLRAQCGAELSAQDRASLDLLLAAAPVQS